MLNGCRKRWKNPRTAKSILGQGGRKHYKAGVGQMAARFADKVSAIMVARRKEKSNGR